MATAAASKEEEAPATRFAKDHLKAFVERIERLEEEKKTIADDIRDVYAEAKGTGFDVKALRTIVRLRKQDADERREHETILETYMHALGMLNSSGRERFRCSVCSPNAKNRCAANRVSPTCGAAPPTPPAMRSRITSAMPC